jgi:5-methylcytosine-specific restriction endonuclease McrA
MAARVPVAGRSGRPWRTVRAQVLAASRTCWLCGHDGSDSVDHVIARAICLATGQLSLLNDIANLRPAHHRPCPECGQRCNRKRGMGTPRRKTGAASRDW